MWVTPRNYSLPLSHVLSNSRAMAGSLDHYQGPRAQHFHAEAEILQRRIHPQDDLRSVGWPYRRSVVNSQVTDTEAVSTPPLGQVRKQDMV